MMDLKECILKNMREYTDKCNETALKNHEMKLRAPVLFIIFENKQQDAVNKIKEAMSKAVLNADGVNYLVISENKSQSDNQTVYLNIPFNNAPEMEKRSSIAKILEDEDFLKQLGEKLLEVKKNIMESGKKFSYWEQINVCSIIRASDEESILMPDIMILVKNKLSQDFKQVFTDLFVILEETGEDASPLNKALCISFFKEIDMYQRQDYSYEKATEVLEDGLKLNSTCKGPVFDLVYILSDTKVNGQNIDGDLENHYNTISAINVLKNKEIKQLELNESKEQFNYNVFYTNIKEDGENRYCSARESKVKKPGEGIYLAVCYYLFKTYKNELSCNNEYDYENLMEAAGLSDNKISELINGCIPDEKNLLELKSLMAVNVSYNEIKALSFKDAEDSIYKHMAEKFFEINFTDKAYKNLEEMTSYKTVLQKLNDNIINNPQFGPFAIKFIITNYMTNINEQIEKYNLASIKQEEDLKETYNKIVNNCISGILTFMDKKYIKNVKNYIICEIYPLKYRKLLIDLKLKAIKQLKESILKIYSTVMQEVKKLDLIEDSLKEAMEYGEKYEEEYLVQNVKQYYKGVVKQKLEEYEKNNSEYWLHEESRMGPVINVLKEDEETTLKKIFKISEKYFLGLQDVYDISFEAELLSRANMCIDYEDKKVAAKSQLYNLLYQSLEENSKPCVHLDTASSFHIYLEKYYFCSRNSEFSEYAFSKDQEATSSKVGIINNDSNSSIEKLQIMGGFKLEDMFFYEPALRYYEAYKEKGFRFHTYEFKDRAQNKNN